MQYLESFVKTRTLHDGRGEDKNNRKRKITY